MTFRPTIPFPTNNQPRRRTVDQCVSWRAFYTTLGAVIVASLAAVWSFAEWQTSQLHREIDSLHEEMKTSFDSLRQDIRDLRR